MLGGILVAILFGFAANIRSESSNYPYSPQSQFAQAAGGFNDEAANAQCPSPNANQIYDSSASCGETVQVGQSKKVNLYGCQCMGPLVKGSCTRQNFCQGQQCFFSGSWQSCEEPSGTVSPSGLGDVSQLTPSSPPTSVFDAGTTPVNDFSNPYSPNDLTLTQQSELYPYNFDSYSAQSSWIDNYANTLSLPDYSSSQFSGAPVFNESTGQWDSAPSPNLTLDNGQLDTMPVVSQLNQPGAVFNESTGQWESQLPPNLSNDQNVLPVTPYGAPLFPPPADKVPSYTEGDQSYKYVASTFNSSPQSVQPNSGAANVSGLGASQIEPTLGSTFQSVIQWLFGKLGLVR